MDRDGRLPDGAVHGLIAFTVAAFLLTVALWPGGSAPVPGTPDPGTDPSGGQALGANGLPIRENLVGKGEYTGPINAEEVVAACAAATGKATFPCYEETLRGLLVGRGAVAAFDALDTLSASQPALSGQGHALAHTLGRQAYLAYGSIEEALKNCSFKVFQGCLHGALEAYFGELTESTSLAPRHLEVCIDTQYIRRTTCVHGIGHGLMLYTNANVNASLERCTWLKDSGEQQSCWGGVFMQNLVGFHEAEQGADHMHHHGTSTEPPGYMVERPGDPYFPCSVMDPRYQPTCWIQMADYILWGNDSDFEDAAVKCDGAPAQFRTTCRMRLGFDAMGWSRNVTTAVSRCAHGDQAFRADCIRGIVDEIVLHHFDPNPGIDACWQMPEGDKPTCYTQVPSQGRNMLDATGMAAVCARAEPDYVDECRTAANLPAE